MDLALYFTFFPKVVSGPLVRYCDFNTQINNRSHTVEKFSKGIELIIIGLIKKVIIADTLGALVDSIFIDLSYGIDVSTAWLGAICYMLQIYFDFSGYSDCAIGISSCFGFDFKDNFNFPYISKSITEFWRRWHISLGDWFKNYLYIPLGGSRTGNVYFNLFVVFMATGIWHGASWNFILWGLINAIVIVIEKRIWNTKFYKKIPNIIKWAFTMFVVFFNWILFRADNLKVAIDYIKTMFGIKTFENIEFTLWYYLDNKILFLIIVGFIGSTILGKIVYEKLWTKYLDENKIGYILKMTVLFILMIVAFMFMINSTYSPFIYFRF